MRVTIRAQQRAPLERRLRLALGRHAQGIDSARLTLAEEEGRAGPRLPEGARCRIAVRFDDGSRLDIEEAARAPGDAVAAALWRLEHRLRRRLAEGHEPRLHDGRGT